MYRRALNGLRLDRCGGPAPKRTICPTRALFREWDVVLCPPMPTPAYPHDHSAPYSARQIEIDGKMYPYSDQLVWPEIATTPGLPATAAPIDRSENGLPIGVQIVGPHLEDRTTIAFAALMEREFGGFTPPPGFGSLSS